MAYVIAYDVSGDPVRSLLGASRTRSHTRGAGCWQRAEGATIAPLDLPEHEQRESADVNGATNDDDDVETGASVSLTDPVSGAEGELVEILPGLVAVCGGIDLEALDGVETLGVDTAGASRFLDCVSETVAGANLLVQGTYSLVNVQGLVKFAPETLQALKSAQTVTKGGWNLGTLTSSGGKFVHQVRWVPATGAQAVAVLAGLGPAVALLAISGQVQALSSRVGGIESKIDAIIAANDVRDYADLKSSLSEVRKICEEISNCGFGEAAVRSRIAALGDGQVLDQLYHQYVERCRQHRDGGARSVATLLERGRHIVSDLTALVAVSRACDVMGIVKVVADAAADVGETVRASRVRELQNDLEKRCQEVDEIAFSLRARAHLLMIEEERAGGVRVAKKRVEGVVGTLTQKISKSGRPDSVSLSDVVDEIDRAVGSLDGVRLGVSDLPCPKVKDGDSNIIDLLLESLRWSLPRGDDLLALVRVRKDDMFFVVTSEHWGCMSPKEISVEWARKEWAPLEGVRYVVDSGTRRSGRRIDIVARDSITCLEFDGVEAGTVRAAAVDRVVSLLRTAMNLPEGERGKDPLLLQPASVC